MDKVYIEVHSNGVQVFSKPIEKTVDMVDKEISDTLRKRRAFGMDITTGDGRFILGPDAACRATFIVRKVDPTSSFQPPQS